MYLYRESKYIVFEILHMQENESNGICNYSVCILKVDRDSLLV